MKLSSLAVIIGAAILAATGVAIIGAAILAATGVAAQIPEYTVSKEMREDLYIDHQQDILAYLSSRAIKPTFIAVNNQWSEVCSSQTEDMNVELWVDGVENDKAVALILCYTPSKGVYLTKNNS